MSLVTASSLSKTYRVGDIDVPAIKGIDFAIEPASVVGLPRPRCSAIPPTMFLGVC